MPETSNTASRIVGGVDTHKDLHVVAVVDDHDHLLGTSSFAATRQGCRQMPAWMGSLGQLRRMGIESTDGCGAGSFASSKPQR